MGLASMDLQYTGGVMEFDRFFKFSQLLLRDEFVLSYSGYVSEDILLAVGDTLRERLEDHARDGAQIRNVFSIFVELMQNIIRYGVEGPQPGPVEGEKPSFGIVMVAENDGSMDVIAGNYVTANEADQLVERVSMLQSQTPEELRQMYRERLKRTPDEGSKGASLGLIEIARRSTLPIVCEAMPADDGLRFFMIKATV